MGFDLYGIHARSKKGEYFRNNVWWWRRLWSFVAQECSDILTEEEIENGSFNNGYEYSQETAEKIAERLTECVKDGRAKEYSANIKKLIKQAKKTNETSSIGDDSFDWNESYPFTITNVKEFATFCKNSGGFTIC